MDEIQEKIEGIEEEAGIVKDLYDLVEQYQVPVNPEDMAVYQVQCTLSSVLCKYITCKYYSTVKMCLNVIYLCIMVVESEAGSDAFEGCGGQGSQQ